MPNTPPEPEDPQVHDPPGDRLTWSDDATGQDDVRGQGWYADDWYAGVTPLHPEDPPRIGGYWLDARLVSAASGTAYTAHDDDNPAMVLLLSEGAASDAAARDRFAGLVNALHIDTVLVRGGQGQDEGRLGHKYRPDGPRGDDPVAPDDRQVAPWAALAYNGSVAAQQEAARILDEVALATVPPLGVPAGPDYRLHWIDRIKPGLARIWPLPWPGRFDRAGWRTILVSWLLMLLLAALAVLIAILIFRNQPPQSPPPPTGSGSPPPQSGSPPPQSGSPSPQSSSPSPQSGSPSGSRSPSPSPSGPSSGSPSPSQSGGPGEPSDSGAPPRSPSPPSRL